MEIYEAAASFTTDERFKAWEYASLLTRNEGFRKLEIVSLDAEGKLPDTPDHNGGESDDTVSLVVSYSAFDIEERVMSLADAAQFAKIEAGAEAVKALAESGTLEYVERYGMEFVTKLSIDRYLAAQAQ